MNELELRAEEARLLLARVGDELDEVEECMRAIRNEPDSLATDPTATGTPLSTAMATIEHASIAREAANGMVRTLAVVAAQRGGSVPEIARAAQVTRSTVYRWIRATEGI